MSKVVKVSKSDFERVVPLFRHFGLKDKDENFWRRIFSNPWQSKEDYLGYMILDNKEKPVGFLGYLFSVRCIKGKQYKFCNLTTWIVEDSFKSMGLMLLRPALNLQDYVITNFTASHRVVTILKHLGFKEISTHIYCFPFFYGVFSCWEKMDIIYDIVDIERNILDNQRDIFNAHKDLDCKHIFVKYRGRLCYIIATCVTLKKISFLQIHYVSDTMVFQDIIGKLGLRLSIHFKTFGIIVDAYSIQRSKRSFGIKIKRPRPLLYLSKNIQPEDMDTAYSELVVLT